MALTDEHVLAMDRSNQARMANIEVSQNGIRADQSEILRCQNAQLVTVTRIEETIRYIVEQMRKKEESDTKRAEEASARETAQDLAIDDLQSSRDKQRGATAIIGMVAAGVGSGLTFLFKKMFG